MAFGAPNTLAWLTETDVDKIENVTKTATKILQIEVCSFFEKGVGFTCAGIRTPDGEASVQGWVVGRDKPGPMPEYMIEASAYHALRLAWGYLPKKDLALQLIQTKAGDSLFCRHMNEWFNAGTLQDAIQREQK